MPYFPTRRHRFEQTKRDGEPEDEDFRLVVLVENRSGHQAVTAWACAGECLRAEGLRDGGLRCVGAAGVCMGLAMTSSRAFCAATKLFTVLWVRSARVK